MLLHLQFKTGCLKAVLVENMKKSMHGKRITRLRQSLAAMDIDTAWIIQPENRRYLSGFKAEDAQHTESSGSLIINKSRCVLVTDSRYATEAEESAIDFEVKILKQGVVEELPELLSQFQTKQLGFEADYLTWGLHRQLSEKIETLPSLVRLVPLNGVVEELREVKDDKEIKALEASADLISAILDKVIAQLQPGLSEKEAAWRIEDFARKAGAEGLSFPSIVASGPNSALPHAVPTDRKLREKEPIVLDVGVKLDGYCSDMTRTIFLGQPGTDFKEIYMIVRQAQLSALKEVRAGVESAYPDAVARQVIGDAGFGEFFSHSLGHGVGLATHERPRLGPMKPVKLKTGMVVTVEPGIYIPGKGGVRLEEMVVIEEDGPRVLTKSNNFYNFIS